MCIHCGIEINKRNLRVHLLRKHTDNKKDITAQHHLSCECVDATNGIFAVAKSFTGPNTPIHVIKKNWGMNQQTRCEMDLCRINSEFAQRSNLHPFECQHVKSLTYCPPAKIYSPTLEEDTLTEMVHDKWFGNDKKNLCLQRQREANNGRAPLSCQVTVGEPPSKRFISVFEPNISYYSRLGRVLVSFDTKRIEWHCPCAKSRQSCIHKCIAKWHLFQTEQMLFRRVRIVEDDIQEVFTEGTEDVEEQQLDEGPRYPPEDAQLSRMVHYIFKNKKLPAVLPADVANARNVFPKHLVPLETICTECTENTLLSEPQLITSKATILTMTDVIEGISTYCKCCYRCGMIYRYQEWSDGVHNYDDHILLSLHLCIFLRNSLQTHQAIGSAVEALEKTCGKRFPSHQRVLYAYLHFEALTDHSYTFACVTCGYHPVTVVMDLHKKGVFSMPVSNIEVPPQDFDGKVNAEEFWEGVSLEMISRGLVPSNRQNPFVVCPSYHYWAPWIGRHTRSTSMVLNTEYSKVHTARTPDEASDFNITEDRLTDEILKLKMEAVRSLCKQCGIDSKGSRMDLVMRLRQEMQTRGTYDKIFSKVWGASGGWAVVTCPCAIVYAVKFNLRAESPRDFADILLSMTHFPNLTLYDFARGLATHTNLREPESMPFSPYEGRLLEPTDNNVRLASAGQIKVSLPWLTSKKVVPDENGHPLTGSSEHYALYDRFHEANTKDKKDALRKIELIPEVCGWVNSQCAEQLFAGMRKNNHFLNMMTPTSHIFLVRNILHHYNNARNTKTLEEMKKALHVGMEIEFNSRGQTVMATAAASAPGVSTASAAAPGVSRAAAAAPGVSTAAAAAAPAAAPGMSTAAAAAAAAPGVTRASAAPGVSRASAAPGVSRASAAAPGMSTAAAAAAAAPGVTRASAAPGVTRASAAPGVSRASAAAPGVSRAAAAAPGVSTAAAAAAAPGVTRASAAAAAAPGVSTAAAAAAAPGVSRASANPGVSTTSAGAPGVSAEAISAPGLSVAEAAPVVSIVPQIAPKSVANCWRLTHLDHICASRNIWDFKLHKGLETLVNSALDSTQSPHEAIGSVGGTVLKRSDFMSLGLDQEVEATIANCCFSMICKIAAQQGKDVHAVDAYVVATWQPPLNADPLLSLPSDAASKDCILFPVWKPGHWLLCVLKPKVKRIHILDSSDPSAHGDIECLSMISMLATRLVPGSWIIARNEAVPVQFGSSDCGVFMLMYALYVAHEWTFDFTQHDMPSIRRWWVNLLINNMTHGRKRRYDIITGQCMEQEYQGPEQENSEYLMSKDEETVAARTTGHHYRDSRLYRDSLEAQRWCNEHRNKFCGDVAPPPILNMSEEEMEEAFQKLDTLSIHTDEDERSDVLRNFGFSFTDLKDMAFFLDNVREKMGKRVSCELI
ncbi:hypothetical protein AMEX_G10618 [Astyanax mexicanus]|uniref:SAP domain-containing protein n=1 Tax=Astyanax mexicanus TaxID=7994 RepID=A0A8T2LYG9_ASTMX|nr:hypothetical protein AMEX_G26893 [Astyanax mexicanus]KAG9273851.1 hypothetical protein AMEX_G10618 [Astyanax mexicanus]